MATEDRRQNLTQSPAGFEHTAKQKIGAATDGADVSFGRILPTHRGPRRDGLRSGTAGQAGQRRNGFPVLLLLLSRSANPSYEARTRIPPAPPVAHLSRPAAASIASTSAGPVRRDPRHMRCRRPLRLCLLLLPTLRRLFRRRFLRFSLLRHCCPPSLSVDGDIGAVQSRIDPHYNPITTAGKK